ncbi:MAG: cell division protein BolA [Gammaproteobacteria bacterium]|nr:cell division protein BolA [Gammaproteobacteria bacterium]
MTVCSRIKGVTKSHEWIADLFSVLAVALLFGSIWAGVEYQRSVLGWISQNVVLHGSAIIALIVIDVFLVVLFLSIGSSRFSDDPGERCFGTFRGRRRGGASIGRAFFSWLHHMENVNKKHR